MNWPVGQLTQSVQNFSQLLLCMIIINQNEDNTDSMKFTKISAGKSYKPSPHSRMSSQFNIFFSFGRFCFQRKSRKVQQTKACNEKNTFFLKYYSRTSVIGAPNQLLGEQKKSWQIQIQTCYYVVCVDHTTHDNKINYPNSFLIVQISVPRWAHSILIH